MATPFLRTVHRVFPECQVDFVTSPQAHEVVAHNPHIRDIFIYRKYKKFLGKLRRKILTWRLSGRSYDICFILEQHPQYKEFAFQCVAPFCMKVGFSGEGDGWLNRKADFSYDKHVIENYLHLLRDFFQADLTKDDLLMDLVLPSQPPSDFIQKIHHGGPYVIIHPGTTEYLPYRGWIPEYFADIIRFLENRHLRIVLTGQKPHWPLVNQILGCCTRLKKESVDTVFDKSLYEFAYLIQQACAVICSDTGILHMARALRVPVLGLFGPSNPYHTGSIGSGIHRFIRNDFRCGPCNYSPSYRYNDKKNCLDGEPPACMKSITVEQVKKELEDILRQSQGRPDVTSG